ncbi:transcription initiation factor IID, 18kD subunit-domain-containing protein [Pterulicium gracile]|uniref:Transcription initiation factor TFIID subunit 13 n=1 Tax=Pterulicium gracile TaxID=1884261 RepID=A0A5C3QZ05_9AGAR|nr:transcription initiation factor IID, 18kD subunit-domain-containing protein [Pterula gracilis]
MPATAKPATFSTTYTSSTYREGTATIGVAPSSAGAATTVRSTRKPPSTKGLFSKDLKSLMYGFGDDRSPASDTVNVMEEILVEYITDLCTTAAGTTRKSRLSVEDLRRVLSLPADGKKLARMEELLFMQEDIKRARAQFDENQVPGSGAQGKALM